MPCSGDKKGHIILRVVLEKPLPGERLARVIVVSPRLNRPQFPLYDEISTGIPQGYAEKARQITLRGDICGLFILLSLQLLINSQIF